MSLDGFLNLAQPAFAEASLRAHGDADFTLVEGAYAPLLASILKQRGGLVLVITPTSREAEQYATDLSAFINAEIHELPAWETLPHERLSPSAETTGRRLATLRALAQWDHSRPFVLFASVRSALQPLIAELDDPPTITFHTGVETNGDIAARLTELAYTRVDMVTRRGEFAVRGGILDLFSPDAEHAVRIDFFGDEVDDIRPFSVSDQRSLETPLDAVTVLPSRELLLTEEQYVLLARTSFVTVLARRCRGIARPRASSGTRRTLPAGPRGLRRAQRVRRHHAARGRRRSRRSPR